MFNAKNIFKIIALGTVLVMLCGIVGCGKSGDKDKTSSTSSGSITGGGLGSATKVITPMGYGYGENTLIQWSGLKANNTVNIKVTDADGKVIEQKTGLTGDEYTLEAKLTHGQKYNLTVEYVNASGTVKTMRGGDNKEFICIAKNSTDSKGYNFNIDGSVSLEVINNYLNHASAYMVCDYGNYGWDPEFFNEGVMYLLDAGIKYVQRAVTPWTVYPTQEEKIKDEMKECLRLAHVADPEIIFEAGIFETSNKEINDAPIPAYVFEAFGLEPENRNFVYEDMAFRDGSYINQFGNGIHTPDVTRLETQLYFYWRATHYIDLGFEAIHLGQSYMMGKNDENNECWAKVIKLIREYAKTHARRGYVILNSHELDMTGPDGVMLTDFNAYPLRIQAKLGSVDHAVSENNPQECDIEIGYINAVYQAGHKGTSPSGWYTDKYPYLVEFDNWGGKTGDNTKATRGERWGYDEISWYANQPQWYRHQFIEYLTGRIDAFNENGHMSLPGHRTAYVLGGGENGEDAQVNYTANGEFFNDAAFYKAYLAKR